MALGARAEHERKMVEDAHQTYQPTTPTNDERNNLTPGMATPEHEHKPNNSQHDDEWTEYHNNERRTMKEIRGPHPTNMLQMQTRRTLCQRLSTNHQPEAN